MKRVSVRKFIVKAIYLMIVLSLLVPVYSLSSSITMINKSMDDKCYHSGNKNWSVQRYLLFSYTQPDQSQCQQLIIDQCCLTVMSFVDSINLDATPVQTGLLVKLDYSVTLLLLYSTESLLRPPI